MENADSKKSPAAFRDNASFLNNAQKDSAKTKSNLLQVPSITLPKGGGAIKSIDEKFSVNSSNGTSSFSIPLPFSPGRSGSSPSLTLNYNSGSGNSHFGLGWNCEVPSITRKTDKKLPEYKDNESSDVFIFSGAEDLVPELIEDVSGFRRNVVSKDGITISRYRPRIEGDFARIEMINENGNIYWRVRAKDNIVSVFGKNVAAKLLSPIPGEENKIFKWCLEYTYDDKGNFTNYCYKKENLDNVLSSLSEKNRLNGNALISNIYLKGIQYGNKIPFYENDILPVDFLLEMVFDFGEHNLENPSSKPENVNGIESKWLLRQDPFSEYKAGFEIRTYRLCHRILMFHHFKTELNVDDYLVKSLNFAYKEQPHLTYLQQVIETGYIWNKDGSLKSKKSFPPLEFTYQEPAFSHEVKEVSPEDIVHSPIGIDNQSYQWTDLYSEGISGILSEQANGWFYKENQGNGKFSEAKLVSPRPSLSGLSSGTLSIQDLEANGNKFIVCNSPLIKGYFELTPEQQWISFLPFPAFPNIDFKDSNVKFLDLNGDGMADILISLENEFIWYPSVGKGGYDDYNIAAKSMDEEKGPTIIFADKDEKILVATADMSGDGLMDLVIITYTTVFYYPNMGYGRFGSKISMQLNGCFNSVANFNPAYIQLSDIDGSGTTDILYIGDKEIKVWYNQAGNNFSEPDTFLNPFPPVDNQSKFSTIDLLGRGTSCLVWSSPLPSNSYAPLRYIDFMAGKKPHVMNAYKNNLGKEMTISYKSSTEYYLEDKKNGLQWITHLSFPVQCVNLVTIIDKVSQTRFTNEYSYHHGYYDALEREFRGFARVDQRDSEEFDHYVNQTILTGSITSVEKDLFQPAIVTRTWFHTGAYVNKDKFFNQLSNEYYPKNLLDSGKITDPTVISSLNNYILFEAPFKTELTANEIAESCRTLKGLPLRKEIFSDEGDPEIQLNPYSVTQNNYDVQCIQRQNGERHGIFLSHEKESLVLDYERSPLDPRITHTINLEIDKYGNVLQTTSLVYGRKIEDESLSDKNDRIIQSKPNITYTINRFTEEINNSEYRIPVLWNAVTWELITTLPDKIFFSANEIMTKFSIASEKKYYETLLINEKRMIENSATLFLKNDLTGPMEIGKLDTLGLPYENYLLAFTPDLIQQVYENRISDADLRNLGKYVQFSNDGNYWIKSGRTYFHPDLNLNPSIKKVDPPKPTDIDIVKENFYLPVVYEDNFGNLIKILYDSNHLLINRIIDPLNNEMNSVINYRVLLPYQIRDYNDNLSGVRFDELRIVTQVFAMGKSSELKGDWIDPLSSESSMQDQPGTLLEYDFRYYDSNGLFPNRTKFSARETHYYIDNGIGLNNQPQTGTSSKIQESYLYTDGSGNVVLKKSQAAPGDAPQRDSALALVRDDKGLIKYQNTGSNGRWIGNGRIIYNNKGKIVKQYEPYFDSTPEYNTEIELVQIGFTSINYYDSPGRLIRTENPNGTFSKIEYGSWMKKTWDENDTVLDEKCQWYKDRVNGQKGDSEKNAAEKTAIHSETPLTTYFESLGRPFLNVIHNRSQRTGDAVLEEFYFNRVVTDIEGNVQRITNDRNKVHLEVMSWQYDMLGNICYQHSLEAGDRRIILDSMGKTLILWDSRNHVFLYTYDELHRLISISPDNGSTLYEKYEYGEETTDDKKNNLRGKLFRHFDTAGLRITSQFDFKGNLLRVSRQCLTDYTMPPDWKSNPALDNEIFTIETKYDALNRTLQSKYPDNSIILPIYNETNLLEKLDVKIKGINTITHFVSNLNYNAKGQRVNIEYGNSTSSPISSTTYKYELETNRLSQLLSTKNKDASVLQDLNYTYDPVGNVTQQYDNAQKTIFYGGQKIDSQSNYIYDALYRLIEADGREHIGQMGLTGQDNFNDNWCIIPLQPNSPVQLRNYSQKYFYDETGNILQMRHISGAGSWTRTYQYDITNNKLLKTILGNDVQGTQNYDYTYNSHGSIITMPHLSQPIDWGMREEMQHISLGGGGDAWYVYDSSGQRIRKIVQKDQQREERTYVDGFEIFRVFDKSGNKTLERETLHILDDKQRIAMVDTEIIGNSPTPQLIRFQYSNNLSSCNIEYDDNANIISYEEFHPFGTTAFQATDSSREIPIKRYRYTGMERDEENGFEYHSARYYVPWLGRWMAADPIGIKDASNFYVYAKNNPLIYQDKTGNFAGVDDAAAAAIGAFAVLAVAVVYVSLPSTRKGIERGIREIKNKISGPSEYVSTPDYPIPAPAPPIAPPLPAPPPARPVPIPDAEPIPLPVPAPKPIPIPLPLPIPKPKAPPTRDPKKNNEPEKGTKPKKTVDPIPIDPKQDEKNLPYVIRLQAQGGGIEKSVVLASKNPITVAAGLAGLEALKAKLTKNELRERAIPFAKAERFIRNAAAGGGVGPPGSDFSLPRSNIRVDVNVLRGVNFRE
jgi:RHS repeat-associated protein